MNEDASIEIVEKDGGTAEVKDDVLQLFKEEIADIARNAGALVTDRRVLSEEARFAIWDGQSEDGRKHADDNGGTPAFPFEGASDGRLRVADMIVNERVLVLLAAGMRALMGIKCNGMEIHDEALGGRLTTLLRWVLKNKIGRKNLRRELKKVANYQEGDSPAVGILGVWWKQEAALEDREVSVDQVGQLLREYFELDEENVQLAMSMLMDESRDAESAEWLEQTFAEVPVRKDRAKKMVKELRENQKAVFPAPTWVVNNPVWCAYRLFEDIFLPSNTPGNIQRARCIFLREWLTEAELKERQVSYGYTESFVEKVLEHQGKTGFPTYRRSQVSGDGSVAVEQVSDDENTRRGLYEVVTAYYRAVNAENIPGIYTFPFSAHVDEAAKERELLDYKHGKYPFVEFQREVLNDRMWDSRGVPELVMTDQNALKLLHDSFNDNVTLTTLPPFEVPKNRPDLRLVLGPLKKVKVNRPGEIAPMQMPKYPVGNTEQQGQIWQRLTQYFGRFGDPAMIVPMLTQLHQQGMADDFVDNLVEACDMTLALCQQFMTDEEVQLVTGARSAVPLARSATEIRGNYNIQMDVNVGGMDLAYVKELAEVIGTMILPIDTLSTVQRDRLVTFLFAMINPNLAEETVQPVEAASAQERKDEQMNFALIKAGIEPDMAQEGQNFALRLQVLMEQEEKNPESVQEMGELSRKILDARKKHLQHQYEQTVVNPVVGRQMGKQVLG